MDKGKGKANEEEDESGPEEYEVTFDPNSYEGHVKKLLEKMKKEKMKKNPTSDDEHESSSGSAEAKPSTMSPKQVALAYDLCRQGLPFKKIGEMMGVEEGVVDALALERVLMGAEIAITRSVEKKREGEARSQTEPEANKAGSDDGESDDESDEEEYEDYDPVRWELANLEETIDDAADETATSPPNPFDYMERDVTQSSPAPRDTPDPKAVRSPEDIERGFQRPPTPTQDFVRALKDSKTGSKPYFRKGDVLRIINKRERKSTDPIFELLPLKPPGESGRAMIRDFEPADMAAVDAVRRNIRTEKEADSFRYAVDWEE